MESTPSVQNLLPVARACGQLFFSGQAHGLRDIPWELRLTKVKSHEMVFGHGTFDASQEDLDGYPSKMESLLLLKALAWTTQMVNYSYKYYLWTSWSTHWCHRGPTCLSSKAKGGRQSCVCRNGLGEAQGCTNLLQTAPCPLSNLCGEPPRLPLLSSVPLCLTRCMKIKKKNKPTIFHLPHLKICYLQMPSIKLGRDFLSRFCCCWKMSNSFNFDQFLETFFYPISKTSIKFCSWVQDELQLNIHIVKKKNAVRWSAK